MPLAVLLLPTAVALVPGAAVAPDPHANEPNAALSLQSTSVAGAGTKPVWIGTACAAPENPIQVRPSAAPVSSVARRFARMFGMTAPLAFAPRARVAPPAQSCRNGRTFRRRQLLHRGHTPQAKHP